MIPRIKAPPSLLLMAAAVALVSPPSALSFITHHSLKPHSLITSSRCNNPRRFIPFKVNGMAFQNNLRSQRITQLFSTSTDANEVPSMRIGEIKAELESYGISTKSFLEKKDLIAALEKARAEGKKPIKNKTKEESSSSSSSTTTSREERMKAEMETCKAMKVSELKKELTDLGISTKSFFEKSEFVKALAEARVDGVKTNSRAGQKASEAEEKRDPAYRDVVMRKFDRRELMMGGGTPVIDVRLK
mmetsp:Transcript_1829/g.2769  ORF Transcript_1829/g.2769 Transcript_1829/m.2769 type:complete len:246 (-) Transcript_1829:386-1123(-)|eukprot:CAMPEP_0195512340 /NCGR_PEP_ID=MMETSP0794_2-20130614/4335_1 /TAXON_ID=515487 /ORGANISM="Stephanopyxis turris, Strain CCMP 815" /LENGTH=245 /DNA_ID=CAMNT_0040640101 /DNA_START=62 /DNA_END=799 /DNA_ORIENTATION=+